MLRIASKMKLFVGMKEEYQRRHDEIWPELHSLLKETGISEYSIFLDEEANELFAIMKVEEHNKMAELAANEIMKKWWHFMADIMETNEDNSAVFIPLQEVFYMP